MIQYEEEQERQRWPSPPPSTPKHNNDAAMSQRNVNRIDRTSWLCYISLSICPFLINSVDSHIKISSLGKKFRQFQFFHDAEMLFQTIN